MKYIVESACNVARFTTEHPEQAVAAFYRLHPGDLDEAVTVYVADYIGEFAKEVRIRRAPRITKPDGPIALSTKAGPNNIR